MFVKFLIDKAITKKRKGKRCHFKWMYDLALVRFIGLCLTILLFLPVEPSIVFYHHEWEFLSLSRFCFSLQQFFLLEPKNVTLFIDNCMGGWKIDAWFTYGNHDSNDE